MKKMGRFVRYLSIFLSLSIAKRSYFLIRSYPFYLGHSFKVLIFFFFGFILAERIQCRYQQKILDISDKDHLWHSRLLASVERIQRDDGVDGGICKETISGAAGEKRILI
ncbi:BnaA02g25200D [Brassica napus]|uniref:BnaA02g25200D protein n=1 Tax=Brassica napus TaxID=3708 RepID=A0A078GTV7_BRANA|nr:BnaA02g25200D [Brassica napus]